MPRTTAERCIALIAAPDSGRDPKPSTVIVYAEPDPDDIPHHNRSEKLGALLLWCREQDGFDAKCVELGLSVEVE